MASPFIVNTLSFSENGYHLAAPDSTSSVAIWDLRKQKPATSIELSSDAGAYKINKIRYDPSALWFGVAGNHDVRLIAHKTWKDIVRFEGGEASAQATRVLQKGLGWLLGDEN